MGSGYSLIKLCRRAHSEENARQLLGFLNTDENPNLDVNERDHFRNTPIIIVAMNCHREYLRPVMKRLLERGADVNAVNEDGWNCLMILCGIYSGPDLKDLVELLVSEGIDINATDEDGMNCLMFLCKNYSGPDLKDLVELLVSKGIDVNATNKDGWNCLMSLCSHYSGPDLKDRVELLVSKGFDVNATEERVSSLLITMSRRNCMDNCVSDLVNYLCSKIPPNYPAEAFNQLIYYLARSGCWKSLKQIAQRADCLYQDASGISAAGFLQELSRGSLVSLCTCCRNQVDLEQFEALIQSLNQKTPKELPAGGKFSRQMLEGVMLPDTESTSAQWREHRKLPTSISQGLENLKRNLSFSGLKAYVDSDLTQNENWQMVITAVRSYVTSLVEEATKLDRRFEGRLVPYGSSTEKTKLLLPDEFDYLLDLKHFRQDQEDTKSILYSGEESTEEFYSKNTLPGGKKKICSFRLLYYFWQLVNNARNSVPSKGLIFIDSFFNKTCVTLDLIFNGKIIDEPFQVSVDITLGVRSQDTLPDDLPEWCSLSDEAHDSRVYLVSDRIGNQSFNWKESYPCLERDSILRGGPAVQRCLRLLKLLIALKNWELNDRDTQLPTKTHPSSYAIKTCALHYMKQNPPPWDDRDLLKHCLGICKILSIRSLGIGSFFCAKVVYMKPDSHDLIMKSIKHQLCEWSRSRRTSKYKMNGGR